MNDERKRDLEWAWNLATELRAQAEADELADEVKPVDGDCLFDADIEGVC